MPAITPYFKDKLERLKQSKARALDKAKELGNQAITAAEIVVTGGAIGYLETSREQEGKPPLTLLGFDLEEAVALGGHLAPLFGLVGGAEAEHMRSVANGAAAVYGYKRGREIGSRARTTT